MFKSVSGSKRQSRRQALLAVSALTLAALMPTATMADDTYPNRVITLIVAYPPGGGVDLVGRLLARELESSLGQTVVVENRPGAGSAIGTSALVRAKPDGYTLMVADPALIINPMLSKQVTYDVKKDLLPISTVTLSPLVLSVAAGSPVKSLSDLVDTAKNSKDGLTFASAGIGTTPHMAGELLKLRSGANFLHVPYKGSGPAMTDLVSGQVDFAFATQPAATQYISQGRLRGLATTDSQKSKRLPDIPTVAEDFPDFRVLFWTSLMAPAGTPPAVVERLNTAVRQALESDAMRTALDSAGEVASYMSQPDTAKFFESETAKWQAVVTDSKLQPN
jgi:tripartite-type tricarboxylate transporter receptor subunit TctC